MFPKKHRLSSRKIILAHTLYSPLFTLRYDANGLSYNRYGFIVSKKVDARATVRNRVKRVFRSCVEELHGTIRVGFDFLFVLKKSCLTQNRAEILRDLKNTLQERKLHT